MGRMVANKGNGITVSTAIPMTGIPQPIDAVLMPPPPGTAATFVNIAQLGDAVGVVPTVCTNGNPVVVKPSIIPTSSGAPPTAIKGVISPPPVNNQAAFTSASATVFAGGQPLVRHRDTTTQNMANCVGAVKLSDAFTLHGSGITIDGNLSQATQEQILRDLEAMHERPRTKRLLDNIRRDRAAREAAGGPANTITITTTNTVGSTQAQPIGYGGNGAVNDGVGVPSRVMYIPGQDYTLSEYPEPLPPDVVLAHELIHAHNMSNGTEWGGQTTGTNADGSPASRATRDWELQAMGIGRNSNAEISEAAFAQERGLPVRTSHGSAEGHHEHHQTPGTEAPVAFSTGTGGLKFVYANN